MREHQPSGVSKGRSAPPLPRLRRPSSGLRQAAPRADESLVTIFARSLSSLADRRLAVTMPSTSRRLALLLASIAIVWVMLVHAAPASAVISGSFGLQKRAGVSVDAAPLQYHGGPVLHSSDAYVVYWDPIGNYRGDWERLIDRYFEDVGDESGHLGDVFAVDTQYSDSHGRAANQMTFRGSYKDEDPYPTSGDCSEPSEEEPAGPEVHVCLTDAQIQAELQHLITSVDPPLPGSGGTPVYYVLTPPGVTVCTGSGSSGTCSYSTALKEEVKEKVVKEELTPADTGICGYHSVIEPGGSNPIPYVVQPWIAGDAGEFIESFEPLITSGYTGDVLACQDDRTLKEPNQLTGLNPFGGYAEGLADVIINDLSIEQRNVVVNPLLATGWYQTATNAEQGDMCQFNFGPPPPKPPLPNTETHAASMTDETINADSYYVAWGFDSADVTSGKGLNCWSGVTLEPYFTAPNPVFSGDIVGFNGTESNITLDANTSRLKEPANEPYTAPVYTWNFGDGSTVSGVNDASEFHSYQYGGTYTVTLTVADSGGNVNSTTRLITVVGAAPPGSGGPGGSGGTSQTSAGNGSSSSSSPAGVPAPVATAAIVAQSLRTALRKGLAVSYSVNEQVAGHFEVLLSRVLARRLGIGGAAAVGLPPGSPAEIVIAKAILVTTKAGHSALHIQFSKHTAARLARVHKVSLMLRLIVRNAASSNPATTTVVSSGTLSH